MAELLEVTDASFNTEIEQSPIPSLIDFGAVWCGPCRALAPTIEELSEEYAGKVKVCKVDVDNSPAIAERFAIRSVPTMVFIKNGEEVDRLIGNVPRKEIVKKIDNLLGN